MKRTGVYRVFEAKDGRLITLRPLNEEDLEALVVFANKMVRERKRNSELGIVSLDRRMTKADEKEFLSRLLEGQEKRRTVSVAAFHGRLLVGHCDIFGRPQRDVRHTGVLGIAIVEGYRGVGLGEAMIRVALAQASKIGVWLVELTVFAINRPARSLYEKLGFRASGIVPKKILRGGRFIDEVQMYAHLSHK